MTRIIALLFIAIVAGGIGWYFAGSLGNGDAPRLLQKPLDEVGKEVAFLDFETKTIDEKEDLFEIEVKYPVFEKSLVDKQIKAFIDDEVQSFRDLATTLRVDPEHVYGLWITFEVVRYDEDIISVKFTDSFATGGAHPNHVIQTFVFDAKSGEEIALKDLFAKKGSYLNTLSEFSRIQLREKDELAEVDDDYINGGTEPNDINFGSYALTEDGVILYFESYQVAPYAFGEQLVEFTFEELGIKGR